MVLTKDHSLSLICVKLFKFLYTKGMLTDCIGLTKLLTAIIKTLKNQ